MGWITGVRLGEYCIHFGVVVFSDMFIFWALCEEVQLRLRHTAYSASRVCPHERDTSVCTGPSLQPDCVHWVCTSSVFSWVSHHSRRSGRSQQCILDLVPNNIAVCVGPMGGVLVFFSVIMCVSVCVLRLADLCVWAQSFSAPAGIGDSYLLSALVLGLCNGMCWGRLFLGVSRMWWLFFGCLEGDGIGLILPCIRCLEFFFGLWVFFYRNLNVEFRSGVFPNLRSQIL